MQHDLDRILLDRQTIARRVHAMGEQIAADLTRDLGGDLEFGKVVIMPIMTGSMIFVADLIRELPLKLRLELVAVSSYPGKSMESKGVKLRGDLPKDLAGKHVLIIDDILDSGHTLDVVSRLVREQKPASLRLCVFLRKPGKASVDVPVDYVGFDIPDEFVVGYGLDYDGHYRNYPQIGTLRPEAR